MHSVPYSVVIPTYNRRRMLTEAIHSVMRQAFPAIEIIVVDDGSSDGTADMLARNYPNVRCISQTNQGPAAARNRGIQASRGELIAFLDSDDVWLDHKTGLEMSLLAEFPEAAMLAGNASSFVEGALRSADTFAQRNILFEQQAPRYFDWSLPIMKLGPVCCTSSNVFRRSALLELGTKPFDESLRLDEDWDLEFRFFSRFKGLLYSQVVCHRRVVDDGTRHFYSAAGQPKSSSEQHRIWKQQRNIISRYLDNPNWDGDTLRGFQQRQQELTALLDQSQQ